jgi:serine phosphatase RsbU (regulator of sigma subunit)
VVRHDLEEIYGFYVDEDRRARLAKMRRIPRFCVLLWWLLKSLLRKLSPIRRTLLLISLICLYLGRFSFARGQAEVSFNFYVPSILILLWIVMLELKDKLMVREEMEIGRAVQLELLPESNPTVPGWGIWLMSRPANDVGGDLADYLSLDSSRLGLSLGDVAGKGLGAAMLMAKLQATLRAIAPESRSLAEMGERINRIFCRDCGPSRFATLIYAELAKGSNSLRILNAGHPSPIVVSAAGVHALPSVALPIGVMSDAIYVEQRIELESRDLVVCYSDGVSEARNGEGDFFGEERLEDLLSTLRDVSAEEVGARVIEEVERFMGDAKPSDDLSLIILQRL